MVSRRSILAAVLSGCGGGSVAPLVNVYGDSLTSGRGLAVTPVQRMQQAIGSAATLADYSAPTMRAVDALYGHPALPFTTLPEHVKSTRPAVAAILYGGADIMTPPDEFYAELRVLAQSARDSGSRVVLATVINHPGYFAQLPAINAVIWAVASACGAIVADAYALPTGGFLADGIHPDQDYANARADMVVGAVRQAIR